MTCKDCIHYELCQHHIDEETSLSASRCRRFKNKADFVEVVRCKDCKHKVDYCGRIMCGRLKYELVDGVGGLVATVPKHFCSYGERRDK